MWIIGHVQELEEEEETTKTIAHQRDGSEAGSVKFVKDNIDGFRKKAMDKVTGSVKVVNDSVTGSVTFVKHKELSKSRAAHEHETEHMQEQEENERDNDVQWQK